jgi:hypothetical protein
VAVVPVERDFLVIQVLLTLEVQMVALVFKLLLLDHQHPQELVMEHRTLLAAAVVAVILHQMVLAPEE